MIHHSDLSTLFKNIFVLAFLHFLLFFNAFDLKAQSEKPKDLFVEILGNSGSEINLNHREMSYWKTLQLNPSDAGEIVEFKLTGKANGNVFEMKSISNKLTKEMRSLFASGAKLEDVKIVEIQVTMEDKTVRTMEDISLTFH